MSRFYNVLYRNKKQKQQKGQHPRGGEDYANNPGGEKITELVYVVNVQTRALTINPLEP